MNPETPSSPQQPNKKGNAQAGTPAATATPSAKTTPPSSAAQKTPPLYRPIDWFTFGVTTLLIFIGYMLTLSPDLTLEDSGELAVGSMYAGVPHPPGYPVWTVFTWIFTKILPFGNIAWRVSVASAFAASVSCGLLALLASRGSSMIIESIAELKGLDRRSENAICIVSGFVSAMLLAYNGFMWSQAVIVEVYPFSVLSLLGVLACLLRWMYAPHQRRYIYWAAFLFGICITNHQTLIVAAMGLEVAIIAANPKLGRDLLVINCLAWVGGMILDPASFKNMNGTHNMIFTIFMMVGIASAIGLAWLIIKTQALLTEWKSVLIIGLLWAAGAAFYFYMPIASMSNPPMNWGYPRTVEGFFHALSRGQYERTNPTPIFDDPGRFISQIIFYVQGAIDEFTLTYLLFAVVPFIFFMRMQKRERAWMVGLFGIYVCLAFLLLILLNPSPDRQTKSLVKVFFTASYVPVVLWIGYGMTITAAWLVTQFKQARMWVMIGAGAGVLGALLGLHWTISSWWGDIAGASGAGAFFKELGYMSEHLVQRGLGSLPIWGALVVLALSIAMLALVFLSREKINLKAVLIIFALMPAVSVISHWAENEQRGHLFGFYFGHDMFTPPFAGPDGKLSYDPKLRGEMMKDPAKAKLIYPEMARDAVLYGGTDPGRFCPTYMIFDESFIAPQNRRDPNYDRRDVYIITQNALADNTYLAYIRAHYNRSAQIDPPFFQKFLPTEMPNTFHNDTKALAWLDDIFEGLGAKIERSRRCGTSWFKESDLLNVQDLASKMQKDSSDPLGKYLYSVCSKDTQALLDRKDASALKSALVKDFNEILQNGSIYSADRFKNIKLPILIQHAVEGAPEGKPQTTAWANTSVRLNRRMLEEAYPNDIAKSLGGVFPDTEIRTASVEDSAASFNEYIADASKRAEHDQRAPNEPRQVKPGEDVHFEGGRVQVSGQVAVMAINGLLTKVIFDKNPDHEFYVEESFPLDWMYPYLTPFGIIMKVNRQQIPEMTEEIIARDHDFWSRYSERLIGNWITYETTVDEVCNWAEQVYFHHDLTQFKGDPKFARDDDGQKAFSKLRSSIGGSIYQWRYEHTTGAEQERCRKEAEFALKQAFAYCPYSPEAVFRYVNLLLRMNRVNDAIRISKTCQKLDPYNAQIANLIEQLENSRKENSLASTRVVMTQIQQLIQARRTNEAARMLEDLANRSSTDPAILMSIATAYVQFGDLPASERIMKRMTASVPDSAETWYNLASLQAAQHKTNDALETLRKAMQVNQRNPAGQDLRTYNKTDRNFDSLRSLPEFQKIMK